LARGVARHVFPAFHPKAIQGMRFICNIGATEYLLEADTFDTAARWAAETHASAQGEIRGTYSVHVAEANDADSPLYVGGDYTVTLPGPIER